MVSGRRKGPFGALLSLERNVYDGEKVSTARRDGDDHKDQGRGRSEEKRKAMAFADLAKQLAELPRATVQKLPVTESVLSAILQVRETKSKAARKRHHKHLASVLRTSPSEALQSSSFWLAKRIRQLSETKTIATWTSCAPVFVAPQQMKSETRHWTWCATL